MRICKTLFLFSILSFGCRAQEFDTLHVFFRLDKNNITEQSTKYLDSLTFHKVLRKGNKITLLGYGDYLGSAAYNENLSYSRAKNIQDYLVLSGFSKDDIKLCAGKGQISSPAKNGNRGNSKDRKVEIVIDKYIDTPAEEKFNFALLNLKPGQTYPLFNIHFFQSSLGITPDSKPQLKLLYNFLEAHKSYQVQFEGHICCIGLASGDEPYDNSTLSMKRAELVRDSMVHYGIDSARIKCVGLGNYFLIRDEETGEELSDLSRRVEIRILNK